MVARVCLHLALCGVETRRGLRRLLAQLEFGFDGPDRLVLRAVRAHQLQRLPRALDIAALEITARETRYGLRMTRFVLKDMRIGLRRLADIAGVVGLFRDSENFVR